MYPSSSIDAALDRAIEQHQAGDVAAAEAAYRAILQASPDEPDALNLLGLLLQDRGQLDDAIALIERALELDADFPEALTNLARAKHAIGAFEAALACASRAAELDPALAEAHHQYGRTLLDLMRDTEALAPLEKAVELAPGSADHLVALGTARLRLHDVKGAVDAYEAVLRLDPDRAEVRVNLAACLLKLDQPHAAIAHQQYAIKVAPDDPVCHAALAASLRALGDIPGSVAASLHAATLAPDYPEAWLLLGANRISLGQFNEAETCFRTVLALVPNSGGARAGLAAIGRAGHDQAEIDTLSARLHDASASHFDRISAGFALGAIFDREARYDDAFAAYKAANDLVLTIRQAEGLRWNVDSADPYFAWAAQTFTPDLFAAGKNLGNPSDVPVFVVGMPRSGTTLVEQVLASHPHVHGAGELRLLPELLATLDGGPAQRSPLQWDADAARTLAQAHIDRLTAYDPDAARVVDKLPDNILALGHIALLFPNAKVIICRRDPRDVCLSSYFQYFGDGNAWSYDLEACATRATQIDTLTELWLSTLPLSITVVSYEKLVDHFEAESRRLIAFLGLGWDPACLDFHKHDRIVLTASHWQVRQPLYKTSAGRWQNYRQHIGRLLAALGLPDDAPDGSATVDKSISAEPTYTGLVGFARALLQANISDRATEAAHRAIDANPQDPAGHVILGVALMQSGKPEEAVTSLREAVRLAPESTDAQANLASALSRSGDLPAAAQAWRDTLRLRPDDVTSLISLGIILVEQKLAGEAVVPLRQAVAIDPDNPETHHILSVALLNDQQAAEAEVPARAALAIAPENSKYLIVLGEILTARGRFEEAASALRAALVHNPSATRAHFGLARIGKPSELMQDIPKLQHILADPAESIFDRIDAGFALARLFQSAKDYDAAFETCEAAGKLVIGRLRDKGVSFDLDRVQREVNQLIALFTPEKLANTRTWGNPSDVPVFIVGMPRSGTTLTEQIVASHPRVYGRGETKAVVDAIEALNKAAADSGTGVWTATNVRSAADSLLRQMQALDANALRIVDKLPDNLLNLGHIAMLFPRARIIFCRRDLRDVAISCFFENFSDGVEWSFDLTDIGARAYQMERLFVHWKHVLPLPMLEVQYEELVADLEGQSRRLIDFLGLEWDPACLAFHKTDRQIMTASHWQVRQPLYASSVGRWRAYRKHLGPMIAAMRGLVADAD